MRRASMIGLLELLEHNLRVRDWALRTTCDDGAAGDAYRACVGDGGNCIIVHIGFRGQEAAEVEVLGVASGAVSAVAAIIVLAGEVTRARRKRRERRRLAEAGALIAGLAALVLAVRGK